MRIAVFSDVHGNIEGLRAVLAAIDALGADRIVCAGDMLGGGPGHEDVLDLLESRNAVMLLGNHEEGDADLEKVIHLIPEEWRDWARRSRDWLQARVSRDWQARLAVLPLSVSLPAEDGHALFVCHAAPADTRAAVCGPEIAADVLRTVFGVLREDVAAFGHFHAHNVQWLDGKLLVNVASVGLRYDGFADFSTVDRRDGRWIVTQRVVTYDAEKEMSLIRKRGVPEPPIGWHPISWRLDRKDPRRP